jgi:hypothetical protein
MATGTFGTATTSSIVSINSWNPMSAIADIAAIAAHIKGQGSQNISPGAFSNSGRIAFPGRKGFILLEPGDYIGYDNWGWPVVVSKQSIASGSSWVHS